MKTFLLSLLPLLFFTRCAHPIAPSGGPEDATPPLLEKTDPPNGSINIRPHKITFFFDENIQVDNAAQNIVISPVTTVKPVFVQKNKSLSIVFAADSLPNNSTFSINLNNCISDLNEDNKTSYPVYLFSTGNQLDTGKISLRYLELQSTKNIYSSIATPADNSLTKFRGTFSTDSIQFSGLAAGLYEVFIFNDLNKNMLPDKEENIGYAKRTVGIYDSSIVYIYDAPSRKLDLNVRGKNYLMRNVSHPLLENLSEDPSISRFDDTLLIDTQYFQTIKNTYFNNYTISRSNYKSGLLYNIKESLISPDSVQSIKVSFNQDIESVDTSNIFLFAENDTNSLVPFNIYIIKNNIYILPLLPYASYLLKIEKESVTTAITELGTSIRKEIFSKQQGKVVIENKGNKNVWLKIYSEKASEYYYIKSNSVLPLYILKGTYKGFYFYDENEDNLLTPASVKEKSEAEKFRFIPAIISAPGLENIITIDIDK